MDINNVLASLRRMFPSPRLNEAVQTAQEAINGTEDSLDGVSATARRLGLNAQMVNSIYQKYGNTMPGRAVCSILGTTPEALKADAEKMIGGKTQVQNVQAPQKGTTKFPRLK